MDTRRVARGETDMTKGGIYSHIIRFALPIFISMVFQQLYNTADSLIVGQFLGTEALAAVGSAGSLIFLMISFFEGMFMGAGVLISRRYGEGDLEGVSRAAHTNVAIGLISGVTLTVVGFFLTPTLLSWMNVDPEVMPRAVEYFSYFFLGSLGMVMYNVCRGMMSAVGDSRHPLYYLIFSSLLNIALDLLFVGVFRWNVWAAAVATVISQVLSAALCFARLMRRGGAVKIYLRRIRFHAESLKKIMKYGVPSGIQNSVIGLANVIVQSQINTFGKMAMAAFGVHARIEGFAFMPINSNCFAITTFVGQNLGAGEHERAKKGARFGILSAVTMAEVVGAIYFIFAPTLISAFDTTAQVVAFGTKQAHIEALFYCLLALSHAIASVCRGAGKAFVPMTVMLSVWCVFRVIYIYTVMHFFGTINLIYWAYPITWAISSVIYIIYYLKSDWVHGFDKEKLREAAYEV
ncbi:MAG: MATE family efflux transporter [Clostridia bacterium]|nr:MATE family efflux transporter [Clostridia bacterium]